MDLDSGLLRAFVVVAAELHFGHAATRLVISQQALSKRVQRLEAQVGVQLFERDRRTVALTQAGERFLSPAQAAVDAVDAALATVRPAGRALRVDVLDDTCWPVSLVRAALERGVDVETVPRIPGRGADEMLRGGGADVVFGRAGAVTVPWPHDLRRRLVRLEPLQVLVSTTDPWADLPELPVWQLRQRPCWFPMTGAPHEWREYLQLFTAEHDITLDTEGSTLGFGYWVQRAASGAVPPTFIGAEMQLPPGPAVRAVPIVDPVPVYPWSAMWSRRLPDHIVDRLLHGPVAGVKNRYGRHWIPTPDRATETSARCSAGTPASAPPSAAWCNRTS